MPHRDPVVRRAYAKLWNSRNTERRRRTNRLWYLANRERWFDYQRRHYARNREGRLAQHAAWVKKATDAYIRSLLCNDVQHRKNRGMRPRPSLPQMLLELKRRQIKLIRAIRCLTKSNP